MRQGCVKTVHNSFLICACLMHSCLFWRVMLFIAALKQLIHPFQAFRAWGG